MSTVEHEPAVTTTPTRPIPPLRDGDRLSRDEFERRYEAMPHIKKAELIEGVVCMPSPVSFDRHGSQHFQVIGWIGYYVSKTAGLKAASDATNRLDQQNEPQPDVMLFLPPDMRGAAIVDDDGYVTGSPEFICEISASTKSIDLGRKKTAYLRNGVREYLVWRVLDRTIDWFVMEKGQHRRLALNNDALLCSTVFPGLWLNTQALLAGDLAQVFSSVDRGTSSDEHRQFVRRLAEAKPADAR